MMHQSCMRWNNPLQDVEMCLELVILCSMGGLVGYELNIFVLGDWFVYRIVFLLAEFFLHLSV